MHTRALHVPFALAREIRVLGDTLGLWWRRARTRRQLAELDARALADIGLDESQRRRECARRFWA